MAHKIPLERKIYLRRFPFTSLLVRLHLPAERRTFRPAGMAGMKEQLTFVVLKADQSFTERLQMSNTWRGANGFSAAKLSWIIVSTMLVQISHHLFVLCPQTAEKCPLRAI